MRKHFLILLLFGIIIPFEGKSQADSCDSTNTSITSKFRYLGSWDENGRPDYLEANGDEVSQALLDYVNEIAPEGEDLHEASPEYFSDDIQLNTVLTKEADVYLTFVHEGAGWKNVLGFYTYDQNNPPATIDDIDSLTFIFPNLSKEEVPLNAGDKVHLGKFQEGTVIGYFLLAKGWTGDDACLNSNSHLIFTDKHLNTYTTPENQQQTILLNYKQENRILLGIEDIRRPEGDKDFNDAVFYLTSDPIAIDTTNIPEVATAMISGDFELCNNESASIVVDFDGLSPWSMIYTNGNDTTEVSNIQDDQFIIETSEAGVYTLVEMTDALGKGIISGEASVTVSTPLASFVTDDNSLCEGEETELEISVSNPVGTATLKYLVEGVEKEITVSEGQAQVTIENVVAGNYELVSISNESCTTELEGTVIISTYAAPVVSYEDVRCESDEMAVVYLSINNGNAPFTLNYEYNGNPFQLTTQERSIEIELIENGEFRIVSVTDTQCSGLFDGKTTVIDCIGNITKTSISVAPTSCRDEDIELDLNISDQVPVESVSWSADGNGSIVSTGEFTAVYSPAPGEVGTIGISVDIVVNGKTYSFNGSVDILELPDANWTYSPEIIYTEDMVEFAAINTGLTSYTWVIEDEEIEGSSVTYTFNEAGIYEVTLIVKEGECVSEKTEEVEVLLKNALFVPNVFNPNATNPESRVVKVYGNNISEDGFSFRIFNRWGNELYSTNSFIDANSNGWIGVNESNDEAQGLNTFTYILNGNFEDGTKIRKTGTITLVR